jgi:excinuclease ABC subunit B
MAQVIQATQRPALILAPNKILAAQLYGEMKSFFPDNAVEYFVSITITINPKPMCRARTPISKRNRALTRPSTGCATRPRALLEREDVIIVASVSCLYGIGSVETYSAMIFDLTVGESQDQGEIIRKLVAMQYKRNEVAFARGVPRARRQSGNLSQPL